MMRNVMHQIDDGRVRRKVIENRFHLTHVGSFVSKIGEQYDRAAWHDDSMTWDSDIGKFNAGSS